MLVAEGKTPPNPSTWVVLASCVLLAVAVAFAVLGLSPAADAQRGQDKFRDCGNGVGQVRIERLVATNRTLATDGDGDPSDFLVIRNFGFDPIDLDLWQIGDGGSRWVIPAGVVLGRNQSTVIWASGKGDIDDPLFPGARGELHANFRLAPGGETITLAEPSSCIVDQITYPAMSRDQVFGYNSQNQLGFLATPTQPEVCAAPGSVRFTAVQINNKTTRQDEDGEFGDWFEIRNATVEALDLGGWLVADGSRPNAWSFPEGTIVASGDVVAVWADGKNRSTAGEPLHTNFTLANAGDQIVLASSPTCLVDSVQVPELDPDAVWTRAADGTFSAVGGTPPGAQRTDLCMVVNEVMTRNVSTRLNGPGEYEAWIELANYGADPVDLSDWRLRGTTDFWVIPEGVSLAPGQLLLVWAGSGEGNNSSQVLYADFGLEEDGGALDIVDPDGREIALMSYPALGEDESFGINAESEYGVVAAGEATPGTGSIISEPCEIRSRPNQTDDEVAGLALQSTDTGGPVDPAARTTLAVTGPRDTLARLTAALLMLSGCMSLSMAYIAGRRARR